MISLLKRFKKPISKSEVTDTKIERGTYWEHSPEGDYPVTYFIIALCKDRHGVWTIMMWDINFPHTWDIREIKSDYVPKGAKNINVMPAARLMNLIWP